MRSPTGEACLASHRIASHEGAPETRALHEADLGDRSWTAAISTMSRRPIDVAFPTDIPSMTMDGSL
jgi:hypothetical protein